MKSEKKQVDLLEQFKKHLIYAEKSQATIEKYLRDIRGFLTSLGDVAALTKERAIAYKAELVRQYAPASVNSMLVAVNCFLRYIGRQDCCLKLLKIQRQIFCQEEKELTMPEYRRLVKAAGASQIAYVIQTICCTGIRVSELRYITVEAVRAGRATVNGKNKLRVIFIPAPLQKLLKKYIKKANRKTGSVFVTGSGRPLDRGAVWRAMKKLCGRAGIKPGKVFPHNLRHLFARTFYAIEKDIVKLADLLGHSSVNTTRIYTVETGYRHFNSLEQVQRVIIT